MEGFYGILSTHTRRLQRKTADTSRWENLDNVSTVDNFGNIQESVYTRRNRCQYLNSFPHREL